MTADLTSPEYWGERQVHLRTPILDAPTTDLLDAVIPHVRASCGKRFLELGCSPGFISSQICKRIRLDAYGIDNSPQAPAYLENMWAIANTRATLYQCDLREYKGEEGFDVVSSFGLVEHFEDPEEIMAHHHRLCKSGGMIIITIPNFRYVQWAYHYLVDRRDLLRHNVDMMSLETFRAFGRTMHHEVLSLGHVGRLGFWNYDKRGNRVAALARMAGSLAARGFAQWCLAPLLPPNSKYYAPWIVYVARRA